MRAFTLALAVMIGATGCSAVDSIVDPGGAASSGTGENGSTSGAAGPGAGGDAAGYDDAGGLGSMVGTFLRSSPARRLTVEVDYVKGRAPSSRALAHLADVLRGVADKPDGISVEPGNEIASGRDRWTIGQIQALEKANRSAHSGGSTATMWVVNLDGAYADSDGALGVAYSASAAAVFRERIDDATTAIISASAVERSVLTHEAGHLLALVNIGYKSAIDHEDAGHPHHSSNDGSVMYWAVEDVSIKNLLTGGPPSEFDSADKADLAALKKG